MRHLAIYGAGGAGRGVMPLLRDQAREGDMLCFIDDSRPDTTINNHRVMSLESFCELPGEKRVAIAVADSGVRQKLAQRCLSKQLDFIEVRAQSVIEMDDVVIGAGAILSPQVILTSNIRIGQHFQANLQSYVEHDCSIGDFVTFAPAVRCNGNVVIGDGAYIGSNAIIRQGLSIGTNCVIGMGSVVTKDVPAGETWAGNPARLLKS